MQNRKTYIIDFLNIFSDFREIKYLKKNIDFHSVKHIHKQEDLLDFFDLFFTKYISYTKIEAYSEFIFIMKKLHIFTPLKNILVKYTNFNTKFVIIEDQYDNVIIDKNKDDFLCQYYYNILKLQNKNVFVITNDKYRDRNLYIKLFNFDINISSMWLQKNKVVTEYSRLKTNTSLQEALQKSSLLHRCSIPKKHLRLIL